MDNLKKAWEIFVKKGVINRELIDEKIGYSWAKSKLLGLNPFTSFDTIIKSDIDIADKKSKYSKYIDISKLLITSVDYLKEKFDVFLVDKEDDSIFELINNSRSSNFFKTGMIIDEKSIGTSAYNIFKSSNMISIIRGPEHFYSILHNLTTIAFDISDDVAIFAVGPFMEMSQDRIKKLIDLRKKFNNYKDDYSDGTNYIGFLDSYLSKFLKDVLIFDDSLNIIKYFGSDKIEGKLSDFLNYDTIKKLKLSIINNGNLESQLLVTKNYDFYEVEYFEKNDRINFIVLKKLLKSKIDYSKVESYYDEICDDKINCLLNFDEEIMESVKSAFISKKGYTEIVHFESTINDEVIGYKNIQPEEKFSKNILYYSNDNIRIKEVFKYKDKYNINIIRGVKGKKYVNSESEIGSCSTVNEFTNIENIEEMEYAVIKNALLRNEKNITRAATDLGISRSTLYRKMKKYSINP